jgi:putative DeoR family transcriptional regulator (stage III sporulation protein D)
MSRIISDRVIEEANYILKSNDTIRDIAKIFKVSKSTVHKDLHDRLKKINPLLFNKVDCILKYHTDIRHIRGGESTRLKYLNK